MKEEYEPIIKYLDLKISRVHEEITKLQRKMNQPKGLISLAELELLKTHIIRLKELDKLRVFIKTDKLESKISMLEDHFEHIKKINFCLKYPRDDIVEDCNNCNKHFDILYKTQPDFFVCKDCLYKIDKKMIW